MTDLTQLEALARAATPGEWAAEGINITRREDGLDIAEAARVWDTDADRDAHFDAMHHNAAYSDGDGEWGIFRAMIGAAKGEG